MVLCKRGRYWQAMGQIFGPVEIRRGPAVWCVVAGQPGRVRPAVRLLTSNRRSTASEMQSASADLALSGEQSCTLVKAELSGSDATLDGSSDQRNPHRERQHDMPGFVAPVADEREGLLAYLAQQRLVLRLTAHGLTDEQARATPTAGSLSIGGLIKHLATVERGWMMTVQQRGREWSAEDHEANLRLGPSETLAGVLDLYDLAAKETDTIIAQITDLGQPVPVPQELSWLAGVTAWSVRWVLLHLIEETARHAGHADIVRESLDGATALPLMAAAEGWPANPWVQPWKGPDRV